MKNYGINKGKLLSIWQELNKDTIDWSCKCIKSSRQVTQADWITSSIRSYVCTMKYPHSAHDVYVQYQSKLLELKVKKIGTQS